MKPTLVVQLLFIFYVVLTAGCGQIRLGTASPPNETAPNGAIVAQGPFTGLNGKTVSGTAVIYRLYANNAYVIRLEGLTTPSESGLLLQGLAGGATLYQASLRNNSGTQNYTTTITDTRNWNSVNIRSTSNSSTPDYGTALLQSTLPATTPTPSAVVTW